MIVLSPGAYWRELDYSNYVRMLSTSSFGIVTTAAKGPVNAMTLITDEPSYVRTFGKPSLAHLGGLSAIRYLRKGTQLKVVRVAHYDAAASVVVQDAGLTGTALAFTADTSGSWANTVQIVISASVVSGAYRIVITDQGAVAEVYDQIRVGAAYVSDRNYVGKWINGDTTYKYPGSSYVSVAPDTTKTTLRTGTYALVGGDDGAGVSASEIIGAGGSPPLIPPTGLQIFRQSETIDINLLAAPGQSDPSVVTELIDIAATRADCMSLIDPPDYLTVQEVVDWHNGVYAGGPAVALNSSYAATYHPWVQVHDGYADADVWIPPSGHVAGVYAYTDYIADPWFNPAGLNRGMLTDVLDVRYSPNQGDRDYMLGGGNCVNPIVNFTGIGPAVWGQQTLARASTALDRVNVRRMLLYLEKSIATSVRYLVHEPDDRFTWLRFIRMVEPVCEMILRRRGIEDYRVICDETTNTPDARDRSEMIGNVLIKPQKGAEKIIVNYVLLSAAAQFEEFAGIQ